MKMKSDAGGLRKGLRIARSVPTQAFRGPGFALLGAKASVALRAVPQGAAPALS